MRYNELMDILGKNKKRNKEIDDNEYVEKIYDEFKIPHFKTHERRKR